MRDFTLEAKFQIKNINNFSLMKVFSVKNYAGALLHITIGKNTQSKQMLLQNTRNYDFI